MTTFETANSSTTTDASEAIVLPRRHVMAIAVLMCFPLPLLSLAATVVPLPQIVERAAALFVAAAVPLVEGDGPLIREQAAAPHSVAIRYRPSDHNSASGVVRPTTRTRSEASARNTPAHAGSSNTAVQIGTNGTHGAAAEPRRGATAEPGEQSPPANSTDPPTRKGVKPASEPRPGAGADPPRFSPLASQRGGGSGGGLGENPPDPPAQGNPLGGNGTAEPPVPPGSGSGSAPESPPASGVSPDNGHGKP